MKFKILNIIAINLLILNFGISQTFFSEDFEGVTPPALPSGISEQDTDGDGYTWTTFDASAQSPWTNNGNIAISESYSNSVGPLNPDNLLIIGPIDLTSSAGSSNLSLSWNAGATEATSTGWHQENYSVYIGNSANIAGLSAIYSETLAQGQVLYDRSVDVSSFAGNSSVYVIFRHHNCTDEWRLGIDNIAIKTISADNATLSGIAIPEFAMGGNIDIIGEITNNGANAITSIDVSWTDGTTSYTDNLTGLNIQSGGLYVFTHSVGLSVTGGNSYDVEVSISLQNDADTSDNTLTTSVAGLTFLPEKINVGEEKTGEWCGWCPRGAVAMAQMAMNYPNDFIGIAVHNGDGMTVSAYDANIGNYIPGGYPGAGVDRVLDDDPSNFSSMHNQRKNTIVPGKVYAEGTHDANTIYANISAKFAATFSGDYRFAAVLIEDSVVGSSQANYYSGGSSMVMPNIGSAPLYNFTSGPANISNFPHDHVARALGDNEINGTLGSLPQTINANDSLYYTYTFNINPSWEIRNMHVVGMLINGVTGEILNAGKSGITSGAGVGILNESVHDNLKIYPNPGSQYVNIIFKADNSTSTIIDILNSAGQVVKSENIGVVEGKQNKLFYINELPSGFYMLNIRSGTKSYNTRISIQK